MDVSALEVGESMSCAPWQCVISSDLRRKRNYQHKVLCESNNKNPDVWSVSPAPGLQRPVASHQSGLL